MKKIIDYMGLVADWQNFYRDFGIKTDFLNLQIPKKQEGFDRLIIMAQGILPQWYYDQCKKRFLCWKWTEKNLDKIIDFSFQARSAKYSPYAIWVRERVEADEELKELSAIDLKDQGIHGILIEERFAYELKFFDETGGHLDIQNGTLCSGSRVDDGGVPSVGWTSYCREMSVNWRSGRDSFGILRSRQIIFN
ncbi:MAG: hypothetical protein AAB789_00510 [Patescibacteria group bacterium]